MIGLKINNKIAELRPGTSINFKLVNPLFNEDNLSPGSYTFPFDLAGSDSSPKNAAIFKHPDVIENVDPFQKQEAEIFFDGVPFKKGKIKPDSISGQRIRSSFVFGLSTVSDEIKTKKVRDIIAEEVVIDTATVTKKIYIKPGVINPGPYRILVNDRLYEAASLSNLATVINSDTTAPRAAAVHHGSGTSPDGLAAPFIEIYNFDNPNDVLAPISVKEAEYNGNTATGYLWDIHPYHLKPADPYYAGFSAFLDQYMDGSYPDDKFRFPFHFNSNILGEEVNFFYPYGFTKATDFVNARRGVSSNIVTNDPYESLNTPFEVRNFNSIQPFLKMKYVLDAIGDYFGFEWEGDFYESTYLDKMLVWNAKPLDVALDFIGTRRFVFWQRSFKAEDLFADLTVVDMLKALQSRYNLGIWLNEDTGRVRISGREFVSKAITYRDFSKFCSPIDEIIDESITGMRLKAEKDDTDAYSTDDEYVLGEPEEDSVTKLGAIYQFKSIDNVLGSTGDVTGVLVSQPQNSNFKFRVFYYEGTVDNGNFEYAGCARSPSEYLETFGAVLDSGIHGFFWKRWLMYRTMRKRVMLEMSLPFAALASVNWEEKCRFDRNHYLIRTLDFTLQPTGITICRVELYTMV